MGQYQDAFREILRKLEEIDSHLGDLDMRLTALESESLSAPETAVMSSSVPPASGPHVAADEPAPLPESEPPTPPDGTTTAQPEPPPIPQKPASVSETEMPPLPVPGPSVAARTGDATELAAGARTTHTFKQSSADRVYPRPKPAKPKDSLEMRIASVGLLWAGLLFLALAAGFLAREYAQGPLGKVVFSYLVSFALIAVGLWKERKYSRWARPVLAGGLAFSYFTSYAMGFVEPMRLLDSLSVKLAILGANLALIFGVAQWKRSEVIAGTALVLGYITTGIVGDERAAFSSSLALSIVAVVFLWLNKWFISTAIAAAATYIAHLYVWQAMPDSGRSPAESFWFHGLYLSMYFIVFTAAGLVGKSAARADAGMESHIDVHSPAKGMSRYDVLASLTQVNLGAYLGGMVALLKLTEVYWDSAWLFFLPLAVLFSGIGLLFGGLRAIQNMYLTAAIVSLTLGIVALLSPMWLPIFMVFQALALLWGARQKEGTLWQWLSLASLTIALLYIGSSGRIDVLRLSTNFDYIQFPWWVLGICATLSLVYAGLWEKRFENSPMKIGFMVPGGVAVAAAAIWNMNYNLYETPWMTSILGLAVPVVAVCMVLTRVHWPSLFLLFVGMASVVHLWDLGPEAIRDVNYLPLAVGIAGLAAANLIEKRGTGDVQWDMWIWRGLYVWGQACLIVSLLTVEDVRWKLALLVLSYVLVVAAGWLSRSSALAKSGYVILPAILLGGYKLGNAEEQSAKYTAIGVAALLLAGAFPLATQRWKQRTGDRYPVFNQWGQAAVVFTAGIVLFTASYHHDWNRVLVSAIWALVAACFAAMGMFPVVAVVVVSFMVISGFALVSLASRVWGRSQAILDLDTTTFACVVAVMLLVAAERVLRLAPAIRWRIKSLPSSTSKQWITPIWATQLTGVVAISTLVMAIMSLRLMPELQHFYFTGAIVGAAFVWIVFGFWFNESAYRKSGFAVLCFGLVKGLIWDLWSLKETIYRVISGAIIGVLAIAASFLYTHFRGRIAASDEETGQE